MNEEVANNDAPSLTVPDAPVRRGGRYNQCKTNVSIEPYILSYIIHNPLFAEVFRHIRRVPTLELPTMGVTYDRHEDNFILYWNPEFVERLKPGEVNGILCHEVIHIVMRHLNMNMGDHALWNIAGDLSNNSIVLAMSTSPAMMDLPPNVYIPGRMPKFYNKVTKEYDDVSPEQLARQPMISFIANLPPGQGSFQYFYALKQAGFTGKDVSGDHETDVHFDMEDSEYRDRADEAAYRILTKAVANAETKNNWGNLPVEIQRELKKSITRTADWRNVTRLFVGAIVNGKKTSTFKKINRRHPYTAAGVKRTRQARLLIAVDQSGSVSDDMAALFYSTLIGLTKDVDVDVIPFDSSIDKYDLETWKRGTVPIFKRTRQGGTDFNAPTNFVNDEANRGRWDGLIIFTDGEASAPGHCKLKRAWAYPDTCKLHFSTNETKIVVSNGHLGINDAFGASS